MVMTMAKIWKPFCHRFHPRAVLWVGLAKVDEGEAVPNDGDDNTGQGPTGRFYSISTRFGSGIKKSRATGRFWSGSVEIFNRVFLGTFFTLRYFGCTRCSGLPQMIPDYLQNWTGSDWIGYIKRSDMIAGRFGVPLGPGWRSKLICYCWWWWLCIYVHDDDDFLVMMMMMILTKEMIMMLTTVMTYYSVFLCILWSLK